MVRDLHVIATTSLDLHSFNSICRFVIPLKGVDLAVAVDDGVRIHDVGTQGHVNILRVECTNTRTVLGPVCVVAHTYLSHYPYTILLVSCATVYSLHSNVTTRSFGKSSEIKENLFVKTLVN